MSLKKIDFCGPLVEKETGYQAFFRCKKLLNQSPISRKDNRKIINLRFFEFLGIAKDSRKKQLNLFFPGCFRYSLEFFNIPALEHVGFPSL
jgi:hypothetical protein